MTTSPAEHLLSVQLEQAGIPFVREHTFAPPRKFRADFYLPAHNLLIEVEGGTWIQGRHTTGKGFESDCRKQFHALRTKHRYLRATTGQVESGEALAWIIELMEETKRDAA